MENNKTHNSLLLTGSFSCWRKWCTKSKFFTLPLFFTKNSRTEAWVIPSFADMLNLCGKVQISPPLLSDRHYFPPSSQLCSNACWELVKSSRACSTWLSTSGRERACVWSWERTLRHYNNYSKTFAAKVALRRECENETFRLGRKSYIYRSCKDWNMYWPITLKGRKAGRY